MEQEELNALRPDLSGEEIMQILDLKPSKQVGEAYAFLMELRLEEGPLGTDEAKKRLLAWWASR
jgi:poly(A) polymerase